MSVSDTDADASIHTIDIDDEPTQPFVRALRLPWYSPAFVNPPYSREQGTWIRMARYYWACEGIESICLIPARPDTELWQDVVLPAPAICYWRGRVRFVDAPAPAPFPSALVYWGDRVSRFRAVFQEHGTVTVSI